MGNLKILFLLAAVLLSSSAKGTTQNLPAIPPNGIPTNGPDEVWISAMIAEARLLHKEEPACKQNSAGVKVTGTVLMAITIDKNGKVSDSLTLSGPKILQPLALATVRKYRYKPYLLNNTPVRVHTKVSISMDCVIPTGQA